MSRKERHIQTNLALQGLTSFRWIAASLGARVIASLAGLVLAFIAAPEAFGVYGRVVLAVLVAGAVVFLRLERSVISSADHADAMAATAAALRIALVMLPVCLVTIWLAIPDLGRLGHGWLPLLALAASLSCKSLLLLGLAWLQRQGRGFALAAVVTAQALVQLTLQVELMALAVEPVSAMLLGDAAGALTALILAVWRTHGLEPAVVTGGGWSGLLKRQWRLPVFNMPATLAAQAANVLPLFAVAAHATPSQTGAVALAQRVIEPAFYLAAALATQYVIEKRYFVVGALSPRQRAARVIAYLGLGLFVTLLLAVAVGMSAFVELPAKLVAALAFATPGIAIAFAVFASGPVTDLVQLAGGEALVFAINVTTLAGGLAIVLIGGDPWFVLWLFAALFGLRAALIVGLWATGRC